MSWDFLTKALGFFATYPSWAKTSLLASGFIFIASLFLGYQAGKLKVSITKPAADADVPWAFEVEATVQNLPTGRELWIMTTDGVRYWPQTQVYQKGNVWTGNVTGIGGEPGTVRTFGVFSIGPDGRAMLDLYRKARRQITDFSKYEIQHLTSDTELVDERRVKVISGKP